jgi:hypothetical protein
VPTKFLYLSSPDHVRTWTHGGTVPLSLASAYRRAERGSIFTPDEGRKQTVANATPAQVEAIQRTIIMDRGGGVHARRVKWDDWEAENVHISVTPVDGVVLCLSNSESREICARLGKIACVAIDRPTRLFLRLCAQLGTKGNHGPCEYTDTANRDVFLKSSADKWQDEYRLFWPGSAACSVEIEHGTARHLWTAEL